MSYSCWTITDEDRERLLEIIQPVFPDVIAHHVTLKNPSKQTPAAVESITVLGQIIDPTGVQVLVVKVVENGEVRLREDDVKFHITWSIDRAAGKKPFSSVEVIARMFDTDFQAIEGLTVETVPNNCG